MALNIPNVVTIILSVPLYGKVIYSLYHQQLEINNKDFINIEKCTVITLKTEH